MKKNTVKKRKGFMTVELGLVLGLIMIIGVAGLFGYMKMKTPTQANSDFAKAMQVVGAVERAAADASGAYPIQASAAAISAVSKISNQMGGNVADLSGWTYQCTASTVTVVASGLADATEASLVATKVQNGSPNWTATASGTTVTMSKTGTCL